MGVMPLHKVQLVMRGDMSGERALFCARSDLSSNNDNNENDRRTKPTTKAQKKTLCEHCFAFSAPGHAELEQGSNWQVDMRANRYSNRKHDLVTMLRYGCALRNCVGI